MTTDTKQGDEAAKAEATRKRLEAEARKKQLAASTSAALNCLSRFAGASFDDARKIDPRPFLVLALEGAKARNDLETANDLADVVSCYDVRAMEQRERARVELLSREPLDPEENVLD